MRAVVDGLVVPFSLSLTRYHTHTNTCPNDSAKEPVRFHAHMTIILFIFDLLDAILMCMSRTTMGNPYLCDFQGIAITTLEVRACARLPCDG